MKPDALSKNRKPRLDRITINEDSLRKADLLIQQVSAANKGVRLTRTDLVNWLIKNQTEEFTSTQLKQIEATFFDSVKYAKWVLAHVKEAKSRGENVTIKIINEGHQDLTPEVQRPKRARKKPGIASHLESSITSENQTKVVE